MPATARASSDAGRRKRRRGFQEEIASRSAARSFVTRETDNGVLQRRTWIAPDDVNGSGRVKGMSTDKLPSS